MVSLHAKFSCSGLDDLRDWTNNVQSHIPIYVANRDFEVKILLQPLFHPVTLFFLCAIIHISGKWFFKTLDMLRMVCIAGISAAEVLVYLVIGHMVNS